MPRVIAAFQQIFDNEGSPLLNGYLKFTVSGTNDTDKDTYSDSAETIPNTNPVLLDSAGRVPDVFGTGSYRVTLFSADDVQIAQFDPVGGMFGVGFFETWNEATNYAEGFVVIGTDDAYYRSLVSSNEGNDPTTETDYWERVEFMRRYNSDATYSGGDVVQSEDYDFYISLQDANSGNALTAAAYWEQLAFMRVYNSNITYALDDIVFTEDYVAYISLQASNTGNAPVSSPTYWKKLGDTVVTRQTGGGALETTSENLLEDSSTYTLPLANSVEDGTKCVAILDDKSKTQTPLVSVSGSDNLVYSGGTDADGEFSFDANVALTVTFISNGVDTWEI